MVTRLVAEEQHLDPAAIRLLRMNWRDVHQPTGKRQQDGAQDALADCARKG